MVAAGLHPTISLHHANEGNALRLVDELVAPDHVYDEALAWAGRFLDAPAAALAGVKALIGAGPDAGLDAEAQARRYGEVFAATNGS